jgi:hypothetical protein
MQTNEQIAKNITWLIAGSWILMKAITWKLWTKERDYPLVPLADLPSWLHIVMLVLFFMLAAWVFFKPGNKYVMMALIVTEAISLLADQTRLQPWHYQFIFSFFAIAFNANDRQKALQAIVLITVFTYLFSGIQKINPGFIHSVWSVHILKIFLGLPPKIIYNPVVQMAGYLIPLIEISGALGLVFKRTMKPAAMLLFGMHIFLLLFLGPLGINYNVVVWPWNLLMMIILWLLFIKNQVLLRPAACKSAANFVVAFFWILMPIAGCFGYWDKFLSSGMYSGRDRIKQFYFVDRKMIPAALRKYAFNNNQNKSARIVLTDWCMQELQVAAVKEPRVLKSIIAQLNKRYASEGIVFVLVEMNY